MKEPLPYTLETIAARLKRTRMACGFKEDELKPFYEGAGITGRAYSNWETGNQRISVDGAIKLEARYGIPLDWTYLGRPEMLPHNLAKDLLSSPADTAKSQPSDRPDS